MRSIKPIKPFRTIDEEAKFWETHDLTDIMSDPSIPLIKLSVLEKEKQEVLTVRMQKSAKEKLEKVSQIMGINPSTLARMWLIERLQRMKISF